MPCCEMVVIRNRLRESERFHMKDKFVAASAKMVGCLLKVTHAHQQKMLACSYLIANNGKQYHKAIRCREFPKRTERRKEVRLALHKL